MSCEVIFRTDNMEEFRSEKDILNNIHLFNGGLSLFEKIRQVNLETLRKTTNWNRSKITVYQNGTYNIELNLPPEKPFSIDNVI